MPKSPGEITQDDEITLLTSDVAELGDVTPATVRLWEVSGYLRARKTPRGVRLFNRRDVIDFLQKRRAARDARRLAAEGQGEATT